MSIRPFPTHHYNTRYRAKYALATMNQLIEVYGNVMVGYDIGCRFNKTVEQSTLLAAAMENAEICICLGSFHGPAHNRYCQLHNHPHNIPGAGLTDFENCETIFSSTNRTSPTTRLASAYHRHQRIHNHLTAYDDDTYHMLGYLLRKKYLNAYQVLELAAGLMKRLCPGATATQLERWRQDEIRYFDALTTEPPENTFAINYIDLLEQLAAKETEYKKLNTTSFHITDGPSSSDLRRSTLLTHHLESRRRTTLEQLQTLQEAVAELENSHGVIQRWTSESDNWRNAAELCLKRRYQASVDDLERLTVMRHCEMAKAGLSGTGYKQRTNIARGIVARCTSLKSALVRYNEAAVEFLGKQARQLTWEDIVNASTLDNFQLLRESRQQVLEQEWARPEVRRVYSSISHEAVSLPAAVRRIQADSPSLGWAAERYVSRRLKVNAQVVDQLNLLAQFPGFTGSLKPGVRRGSSASDVPVLPAQPDVGTPDDRLPQHEGAFDACTDHSDSLNLVTQSEHEADDLISDAHTEDEDNVSEMFARWRLVLDAANDGHHVDAGVSVPLA
ncbi:hypothetical protein FRC12_008575 [Ceratobasidium sp. 428]|nr:hypothetical protein FRC12_008575 [Ceratobasidium sp. 428]